MREFFKPVALEVKDTKDGFVVRAEVPGFETKNLDIQVDGSRLAIPSGGGMVRNMVAISDGRLYMACRGVNKVAIAEIR